MMINSLLIVLSLFIISCEKGPYTYSGTVYDNDTKSPLAQVKVTLYGSDDVIVYTSDTGSFNVSGYVYYGFTDNMTQLQFEKSEYGPETVFLGENFESRSDILVYLKKSI